MAIQNTTFRVYVEKLGASEAANFIGNEGDLFYDPNDAQLRVSDGSTPGGVVVSSFSAPTPGPGIGSGLILGTLEQIQVIGIGSTYQISLANDIVLPGTLEVSGITSLRGSDTFVDGDLTITGKVKATKFTTVSDKRLKNNIKKIDKPLEALSKIEGVLFNWNVDGSKDVGLIAQDVERALPNAVINSDGIKAVNYNGVVGLLVEAVKELSKENQLLRVDMRSMTQKL